MKWRSQWRRKRLLRSLGFKGLKASSLEILCVHVAVSKKLLEQHSEQDDPRVIQLVAEEAYNSAQRAMIRRLNAEKGVFSST